MVLKEVAMDDGDWTDASRFEGDVRDPDNKTPWELACHHAASGVDQMPHVVTMRGDARYIDRDWIDNERESYKLYLEFCEYGDLDRLIERFRAWNKKIPEAFIWHVAECLTRACYGLTTGTLYGDPKANWEEIVHR